MAKKPTKAQFGDFVQQIYSQHHDVIDRMLDENPLLLHGNGSEQTPLVAAAQISSLVTAKKFLEMGANPSGYGLSNLTPLHWAAAENNRAMFLLLLDHGANPARVDHAGATPLHTWFSERHKQRKFSEYEKIQYTDITPLLENRISIHQRCADGRTFLMCACARRCDPEIIDDLIRRGSDLVATNSQGYQALHLALHHGDVENASQLVRLGVSINSPDWQGNAPIHDADFHENLSELILLGADIEARNHAGDTPLIACIKQLSSSSNIDMVSALLAHGANPDAANYEGMTPRSLAKKHRLRDVEKLFSVFDAKNAMMKVMRPYTKP